MVRVRAGDGTDVVREAWLPDGSTEREILIGDTGHGISTHVPRTKPLPDLGRLEVSV